MSNYRVLGEDEQDDTIISFILAQEREIFSHEINLERFNRMLEKLGEGKWRDRIFHLRDETVQRLAEVSSIIESSMSRMPSSERRYWGWRFLRIMLPSRLEASIKRVKEKEAKQTR